MVIRANVFEMSVFHSEPVRDCSELLKSQALVKVSRMRVAFDNGVELQSLVISDYALSCKFQKVLVNACISVEFGVERKRDLILVFYGDNVFAGRGFPRVCTRRP